MIVTLEQLNVCIDECKQMHDECNDYLDAPDYCIEEHRDLFNKYEAAFKHAKYMYKVYKLNYN